MLLSAVTIERDEARAEIAKREEALTEAAESVNQKESALRMTQTKMEALVRTVTEVAAQSEADRARRAVGRTAELEHRAGVEERRRQIEAELAKASELLRSAKATRFKLRERLAAGEKREGELSNPPTAESSTTAEGVTELHKALEQLHPVVEAARKHFEVLHAELQTIEIEEQTGKSDVVAEAESSRNQAEDRVSKGGGAEVPLPQTLAG